VPESDEGSPPEPPFLLSKQQLMDWSRTVVQMRACEALMRRLFDPEPESAFETAHRIYRWDKVSALSHGYLVAAAEHLGLWADVIAPVQRDQDSVTQMRPHPYWLLGRAGLETAARAVWLLEVRTPTECESAGAGRARRLPACVRYRAGPGAVQ
jgi:hypothetical protein